jgi:putative hydrolase of the HAD superfamily
VLKDLKIKPEQAIFVGSRPEPEILCANKAKVASVRIRRGENRTHEPESSGSTPKFEISRLSEVFTVLEEIEKKMAHVSQ